MHNRVPVLIFLSHLEPNGIQNQKIEKCDGIGENLDLVNHQIVNFLEIVNFSTLTIFCNSLIASRNSQFKPRKNSPFCVHFIINDYNFSININWHEYYALFETQLYNKQHVFWKHLNKHYIFGKNILRCDHNILFNIRLSFKSQSKS